MNNKDGLPSREQVLNLLEHLLKDRFFGDYICLERRYVKKIYRLLTGEDKE